MPKWVSDRPARPGRSKALFGTALAALIAILALAGCGGGGSSSSSATAASEPAPSESSNTAGEGSEGSGNGAAEAELTKALKGYYTEPPTEPSPGAKGKSILIISAGQAAETDSALTAKIEEASHLLGWKTTLCDGKLEPAQFGKCMGQALAAHVDGVVNEGADCQYMKPQLEQAKKEGIPVVGITSWDCSEVEPGQPELIQKISYGERYKSEPEAYEALGRGAAAWVAVETNDEAEILYLENQEYNTLKFLQKGFVEGTEEFCTGCQLNSVEWLAKELGPPLEAKTSASLLQYPNTNAMYANTNPELGPSAALQKAGKTGTVKAVGGLGLGPNFEEVREGTGVGAVMVLPGGWYAYAAVDTLNSLFNGKQPRDEGWGGVIVDKSNLPPKGVEGYYDPPGIDYKADYAKSWGVSAQ